jgi:hypothetical protein
MQRRLFFCHRCLSVVYDKSGRTQLQRPFSRLHFQHVSPGVWKQDCGNFRYLLSEFVGHMLDSLGISDVVDEKDSLHH